MREVARFDAKSMRCGTLAPWPRSSSGASSSARPAQAVPCASPEMPDFTRGAQPQPLTPAQDQSQRWLGQPFPHNPGGKNARRSGCRASLTILQLCPAVDADQAMRHIARHPPSQGFVAKACLLRAPVGQINVAICNTPTPFRPKTDGSQALRSRIGPSATDRSVCDCLCP